MKNITTLRDRLKEQLNPGHEIGTFLLGHSNSPEYLVSQLEGWLEAAKADLQAEREWAGHMLSSLKRASAPTELEQKADMRAKFEKFVRHVQAVVDTYHEEYHPGQGAKIVYEEGSVYWKLISERYAFGKEAGRSVYGFVRRSDGAIFKAASWRAPATKPGVRGYLDNYDDKLLGAYGISYKNMGSYGPSVYPARPD